MRDPWVLGAGKNFEKRRANYRAPTGSAPGQPPPVSGWQDVFDGSKDGEESGWDSPKVRVTRLQLDEKETAAGVFERGGGEAVEGIICRTSGWKGDVVWCFSFMCLLTKGQIFFHTIKRRKVIHSQKMTSHWFIENLQNLLLIFAKPKLS